MRAIIDIKNRRAQYAKFNGLTFEVRDLLRDRVGLVGLNRDFPNNQTDFSFSEIVIVDILREYNENPQLRDFLEGYLEFKKIDYKNLWKE